MASIHRFKSIGEFHNLRGLPGPEHPLISLFNVTLPERRLMDEASSFIFDFYMIAMKRDFGAKVIYGQQEYDHTNDGVLTFTAPGQVLRVEPIDGYGPKHSGWVLLIHPDFLWNTPLGKAIRKYEFFDYSVHEALFLSEKKKQ